MKIKHDTTDYAIEQATKDSLREGLAEQGHFRCGDRDAKSTHVHEVKKIRDSLKAKHEILVAKQKAEHDAAIEVEKTDAVIAKALKDLTTAIDEVATADQAVMSDFAERAATNPMDAIVWKADDVMYAQARWTLLRGLSKSFQAQLDERTLTAAELAQYMREDADEKMRSVLNSGPSIDRGPTRLLEEFAKHKAARYAAQLADKIADAWDAEVIAREERPYPRCERVTACISIY